MKKIYSLLMFVLCFGITSSAQDLILKYSQDTLKCTVVELDNSVVKYKYPGEMLINTLSLYEVKQIIMGSGRVIEGYKRVEINGIEDWEKVRVAVSPDELNDLELVRSATERAHDAMTGSFADLADLQNKVMNQLKKDAAVSHCHIIYVTSDKSKKGFRGSASWPEAVIEANFYRYKGTSYPTTDEHLFELLSSGEFDALPREFQEYYSDRYYFFTEHKFENIKDISQADEVKNRICFIEDNISRLTISPSKVYSLKKKLEKKIKALSR